MINLIYYLYLLGILYILRLNNNKIWKSKEKYFSKLAISRLHILVTMLSLAKTASVFEGRCTIDAKLHNRFASLIWKIQYLRINYQKWLNEPNWLKNATKYSWMLLRINFCVTFEWIRIQIKSNQESPRKHAAFVFYLIE